MTSSRSESAPMDLSDDEEDNVSLTSTIEEAIDSDEEWNVRQILAEQQIDGEPRYLIEWQGYPLWDASWEPEDYISEGPLLAKWQEVKNREGCQEASNPKIMAWRRAVIEKLHSKRVRHAVRNRMRAEQGLEQPSSQRRLRVSLRLSLDYLNLFHGRDLTNPLEVSLWEFLEKEESKTQHVEANSSPRSSTDLPDTPKPLETQPGPSEDGQDRAFGNPATDSQTSRRQRNSSTSPPTSTARPGVIRRQSMPTATAGDSRPKKAISSALASKLGRQRPSYRAIEADRTSYLSQNANTTQTGASNVFTGGIRRKKRTSLLEAAENRTRKPRLLKMRHANLLQKASRDREGVVPPPRPPPRLFFLNSQADASVVNESATAYSDTPEQTSPATLGVAEETAMDQLGLAQSSAPETAREQSPEDNTTKAAGKEKLVVKKKRKSVRFDDNAIVQEPMDLDTEDSLFVKEPFPPSENLVLKREPPADTSLNGNSVITEEAENLPKRLPPALRRASTDGSQDGVGGKTRTKKAIFGSMRPEPVTLVFDGMPADNTKSWAALFQAEPILEFTHHCMAKDFSAQNASGALQNEELCKGSVTFRENLESLQAFVDYLKIGSLGVLCYALEFSILIYPLKSEDWGTEDAVLHDSLLEYMIFRPSTIFEPSLLAPISPKPEVGQDHPPGMRPTVFQTFFGLNYDQLLPQSLQSTTSHDFFLAFPPSAEQDALFLAHWLRSCNSSCRIFSSIAPSHWFRFLKLNHGVVIIHENATWNIRLFPGMNRLLHGQNGDFSFWSFTKSLRSPAMLPSSSPSPAGFGDVRLQRVFQPGIVILVTPSFLVSQPQQAYNFVKWFWQSFHDVTHQNYDPYRRGRLAVCADIDDWLFTLAIEKAQLAEQRDRSSNGYSNEEKSRQALNLEAKTAREKTCRLIRELVRATKDREDSGPLITAPEHIDGNDEQSLVNWFGWWSITHMDQFKKFSVIGSSEPETARMSRFITLPKYAANTVPNPDDVFKALDLAEEEKATPGSVGQALGLVQAPQGPKRRLVPNDRADTITNHISNIVLKIPQAYWCPIMLYKFPVSYWNADMAFHFRDYRSEFQSYRNCFRWFPALESPRGGKPPCGFYNTLISFFYTLEGSWNPDEYPLDVAPTRRPWIAIHRPRNIHLKPWRDTELLIWDMTPNDKFSSGRFIYEEDLIEAQREAIHILRIENEIKNPGLPLTRVWMGGFDCPDTEYSDPLDMTLNHLDKFIDDVKYWVPAPDDKLPGRGWKMVKPGHAPRPFSQSPPSDAMDIDPPEEEIKDGQPRKIIFHPPRGNGQTKFTKCKNRLFNFTQDVTKRGQVDRFKYIFRPTMEWYGEQMEEGRGYEHIKVTSWESVLQHYKIPDPKKSENVSEKRNP
ncbi:hypothetical protein G7046_g1040 [Stylonectria norvegica]|nr:hypothetical protein G7046_g1040 [Stylonectria norvegica]